MVYFLMTISLPLQHHRAPILSLYGLFSYNLPTNMSYEKAYHPRIQNYKSVTHIYYWEITNTPS